MKNALWFLLILASGCADTEANASANLQKGDEFFARQEYEVAEYYYERVPAESPLHKQASTKLEEIRKIKKQWVEKAMSPEDFAKVLLTRHSFTLDTLERVPSHRITIENNTDLALAYVEVEFTYFDRSNRPVATLRIETDARMPKHSTDSFKDIEPGTVPEEFVTVTAKLVKARFQ